jgi:hypothetical protein
MSSVEVGQDGESGPCRFIAVPQPLFDHRSVFPGDPPIAPSLGFTAAQGARNDRAEDAAGHARDEPNYDGNDDRGHRAILSEFPEERLARHGELT